MMHRVVGLGFGLLFLLVQLGCNDIVTSPPSVGGGGGGGSGGGDDLCADEGGPVVAILLPEAATDPNTETIVTDPDLTVDCEATSTGSLVDDSSVSIIVRDENGVTETPVIVKNGDGTYSATVDLRSFPNGPLFVACEASDSSPAASCSSATVMTFLDLGPSVVILSPADGSVQAGGMDVEFTFAADPVSDSDNMAALAARSGSLVVAGANILNIRQEDGVSIGTVKFDDPALYQTALNGTYEFSVSVANGRGVTRRETRSFTVDSGGPSITIDEPELGTVIGGATDVVATISDPSGIDPSQVSFYIGSEKFDMDPVPGSLDQFRGSFDANQYPTSIGEVLINVVAVDVVGNEYEASVVVELDGVSPVMDLDPAEVREGKETDSGLECSALFDPVGPEAISNGNVVTPFSYIRARVEDRGNPTASFKSGLDPDEVQVWILRGTDLPLVIDTDGDGTCDSLNPDVLPGNSIGNTPAVEIDLRPISPTGSPDYLAGQNFSGYPSCQLSGDADPGEDLCDTAQIPRVIPDNDLAAPTIPAIYVKAPVIPFYCLGDPFDWQTSLDGIEGPACMAVRAADENGNSNVSRPLQVCFRKTITDGSCGNFAPNLDDGTCTNGCTGVTFRPNELIGPFD